MNQSSWTRSANAVSNAPQALLRRLAAGAPPALPRTCGSRVFAGGITPSCLACSARHPAPKPSLRWHLAQCWPAPPCATRSACKGAGNGDAAAGF